MKRKNLKFIVGGLLIVGVVVWIFGSISSNNLTYYYTPTEVINNYNDIKNDTIRIMGMVVKDSLKWTPRQTRLEFKISDDGKHKIDVEYTGAKPDMFREGQGVVVEGTLRGPESFLAENLLVKHSEEYKVNDHKSKKEDYYNSLQN